MQTSFAAAPRFSPLDLQHRSAAFKLAAVAVGSLILTLSSWIEVPMVPVPITMQTYAVTLIGALYGWRLAAATILAWFGQAAMGMPVLAGGAGGFAHFFGPTGGYLLAFLLVAMLTGWLAERGWNGRRVGLAFLSMLVGNALCLVLGAAWLATLIGPKQAIVAGVLPFILGGVLKSGLAAVTLRLMERPRAAA